MRTPNGGSAEPATGQPAPLHAQRLRMYRGGMWLFILAETFGFLTLFSVRFLVAGTGRPAELDPVVGAVITAVFAASAVGAFSALRAIDGGDQHRMLRGLAWAAGTGATALVAIVIDSGTSTLAPASRFGGAFLATTLFHAIHIFIGLVFLVALWSSGQRGRLGDANRWVVEAGVRFWLFVSAAWLALYVVFYWL